MVGYFFIDLLYLCCLFIYFVGLFSKLSACWLILNAFGRLQFVFLFCLYVVVVVVVVVVVQNYFF